MPIDSSTDPIARLPLKWLNVIKAGLEARKKSFMDQADEVSRFVEGPHDFMYTKGERRKMRSLKVQGSHTENMPEPTFKMTVNKGAELRDLFGGMLYYRNPIRIVTPREYPQVNMAPPIPFEQMMPQQQQQFMFMEQQRQMAAAQMAQMAQARADLLSAYLNYTPNELNLRWESGRAIDQALIMGRGLLSTQMVQKPGSNYWMVGSFFTDVRDLVIDPDVNLLRDATWVAVRKIMPLEEKAAEMGVPASALKAHRPSITNNFDNNAKSKRNLGWKHVEHSNDLIEFWCVYSKIGAGDKLRGSGVTKDLSALGKYCYLEVAEGIEFPLNLPPHVLQQGFTVEQGAAAVQWPLPLWLDGGWPFVELDFHPRYDDPWPTAHLQPALGELMAMDWAASFLADSMAITSRQFIAVMESLEDSVKEIIQNGESFSVIPLKGTQFKKIDEAIQFLQHPPMNRDLLEITGYMNRMFEQRSGITEMLASGQTPHQMRSAKEAAVKEQMTSIRPDAMAETVEDWQTRAARQEAIAIRQLDGMSVAPVIGPHNTQFWDQMIRTNDPAQLLHEFDYRIEAGTARKPNKVRLQENMRDLMQMMGPTFTGWAQNYGYVGPLNAMIQGFLRSIDVNPDPYFLQPPPPPEPMPEEQAPPPPE